MLIKFVWARKQSGLYIRFERANPNAEISLNSGNRTNTKTFLRPLPLMSLQLFKSIHIIIEIIHQRRSSNSFVTVIRQRPSTSFLNQYSL